MTEGEHPGPGRRVGPDVALLRERLGQATFVAQDLSEHLRAELSHIAGHKFQEACAVDLTAAPAGHPVVWVGKRPAAALPPGGLLWFHTTNAGVDDILSGRLIGAETLFTRTVGDMGGKVAEYVLAWILADAQNIREHTTQTAFRRWNRVFPRGLAGQRVIVFGAGQIGRAVSRLLRGCGMRVVGVARHGGRSSHFDAVCTREEVMALLPEASWLVSTLPLTERTRHYFDRAIFAPLRGACFINAGRGATVEYTALRDALVDGRVRGAVLDVLPSEPPPADDPWWELPNTTLTSHSAGITSDSDVITAFAGCWSAIQRGERPDLAVDLERGY